MSIINETLDNLKQTKKRGSPASLNPSSSAYAEPREKNSIKSKAGPSFMIPLSLVVLISVFFVAHRMNTPTPHLRTNGPDVNKATEFWRHATKPPANPVILKLDPAAQCQYYAAVDLLNEGQDVQALVQLKEIVKQYPNFEPAKKAYSMLSER